MAFIDGIKARAKADIKTIVLPESYDMRVIEAAAKIRDEGIAKVVLVGDPEDIAKMSAGYDLTGVQIINPETYPGLDDFGNISLGSKFEIPLLYILSGIFTCTPNFISLCAI